MKRKGIIKKNADGVTHWYEDAIDRGKKWIEDAIVLDKEDNDETGLVFNPELPINYEQKCPVVLITDVSGSMADRPIDELNKGLKTLGD